MSNNIAQKINIYNQFITNFAFFSSKTSRCQRDCRRFKSDHSFHFFAFNPSIYYEFQIFTCFLALCNL